MNSRLSNASKAKGEISLPCFKPSRILFSKGVNGSTGFPSSSVLGFSSLSLTFSNNLLIGLSKSICSISSFFAIAFAKVVLPLLGLEIKSIYKGGVFEYSMTSSSKG